jgi:hypothetical protein
MTGDEVFTQLLEQFDRPVEEHNSAAMQAAKLLDEVINRNARLTNEQCDILDHRIFQSLGENYNDSLVWTTMVILLSANETRWTDIAFSNGPFEEEASKNILTEDYFIHILKKEGVLEPDERPLYWGFTTTHFDSRLSTWFGHSIFTDRNLVIRGTYSGVHVGNNTIKRIYHEEMQDRPYLQSVEILEYRGISDIKMEWSWHSKKVEFMYSTKYLEDKARILYGPLFFKARFPSSTKVKEGKLLVEVMFSARAPAGQNPAEFRKKRATKYYDRLKQCCELKGPE